MPLLSEVEEEGARCNAVFNGAWCDAEFGFNDAGIDDAGFDDAGFENARLDDAGFGDAELDDAEFCDCKFDDKGDVGIDSAIGGGTSGGAKSEDAKLLVSLDARGLGSRRPGDESPVGSVEKPRGGVFFSICFTLSRIAF